MHQHVRESFARFPRRLQGRSIVVCVHVHEHGQVTDSTNWEARGRKETEAQTLAPTCAALLGRDSFLGSCSGSKGLSLSPGELE